MIGRVVVAAALLAGTAAVAHAADGNFYAGKTIHVIVSTAGGGAYDTYARTLAKYMGRYIPGSPAFVVENMPGASGLRAANFTANVAAKDGTYFAGTHSNIPTAPLTEPTDSQYDATKLSWIGSATKELYVGYVMDKSPIHSMEEAKARQSLMGGTSFGSFGVDTSVVSNEFFGTKFKLVLGYKDAIETRLALERGEIDGTLGTNYASAFKSTGLDWLKTGRAKVILQYGTQRSAELPDIPTFLEMAKTEEQRQIIRFMVGRLDHGKPYFAPPGVPADRLALLRKAFDETIKDPDFRKDIAAAQLEIDEPMSGEALEKLVAEEAATPPALVEGLAKMLAAASKK
jgi:tripartite-type tricarboxylate transporter receptor subunit TctC